VSALAETLGDATTLHFDDYEHASARAPENLRHWLEHGADFNALAAPALTHDLGRLKRGEPVLPPHARVPVQPRSFLVLEMPLGREDASTASLIDALLWIDLPHDVALARKLRQLTRHAIADADSDCYVRWLDAYLDHYLSTVRDVLIVQAARVPAKADLRLDGLMPVGAVAARAAQTVLQMASRKNPLAALG
jgi:uridine kinase